MSKADTGLTKENFEVELKKNYTEGSLLNFLLSTVNQLQSIGQDELARETVVELHNNGEIDVLDTNQWATFETEGNLSFFQFQHFFNEMLPKLSASHQSVMFVVKKLVQLGGKDMAANEPNVAFVEWCRQDEKRALSILEDARQGNQLALDHLIFALDSGNFFEEAKDFLKSSHPEARISGAASLGRMSLSVSQETEANAVIISALEQCDAPDFVVNLYAAAFAVAEKSDEVDLLTLKSVAELSAKHLSPNLQLQVARSLFRNAKILDQDCLDAIMKLLRKIDPEHMKILETLDFALPALVEAGFLDTVLDLLENLVGTSSGKISIEQFESFFRKISEDGETLASVAGLWFGAGDLNICAGFASLLSEGARLNLVEKDLPKEYEDLVFMCRKVVGHLFMKPLVAASFLLSVIKYSSEDGQDIAESLLFHPLLLSYEGKLKKYLEEFCAKSKEPTASIVQKVLDRKTAYRRDLEGIETLVELHPNEQQRQKARAFRNEQISESAKNAERNTILQDIPKSYLLYGRSLVTFVEDPDGSTRKLEAPMGEFTFEFEYPLLNVIDPVDLQFLLYSLRTERKDAQ